MLILGIDPGLGGAMALLDDTGLVALADLPTMAKPNGGKRLNAALLGALLAEWSMRFDFARGSVLAVVESVSAMPRQGVSSVFSFGHSVGVIDGVLGAKAIAAERVAPAVWKRHFRLSADKAYARAKATELYPGHASDFARVKDHGRAEAVLIARYGRENFA